MSFDLQPEQKDRGPARRVMPPYVVLRDFLEEDTVRRLLAFALSHEVEFEPTKVGRAETATPNTAIRVSTATRNLGEFRLILKSKIMALLPHLISTLRTTPVEEPRIELQLVAHNEGAFYKRHIDTHTASEAKAIRVLSGVYYFHAAPKAFTGGTLRLYAFGAAQDDEFVDVEPDHNSLLVFPSWAPHEVTPVHCPSNAFTDSRFAINCWVYRQKADATV